MCQFLDPLKSSNFDPRTYLYSIAKNCQITLYKVDGSKTAKILRFPMENPFFKKIWVNPSPAKFKYTSFLYIPYFNEASKFEKNGVCEQDS